MLCINSVCLDKNTRTCCKQYLIVRMSLRSLGVKDTKRGHTEYKTKKIYSINQLPLFELI